MNGLQSDLILEAQEALSNKKLSKAIECFSSLIDAGSPNKSQLSFLHWSRLTCYFELKEYSLVAKEAMFILELPDTNVEQELLPQVYSSHAAAAARLSYSHEMMGHMGKASAYKRMFESLQKYSKSDIDKASELKLKGNSLLTMGKLSDAITIYKEALGYHPKDETILSNLSQAYLQSKELQKSKECAEKCIKLKPNWPKGYYRLGKVCMQQEKYKDAKQSFQKGLNLEPENNDFKRAIAETEFLFERLGNGDPGFEASTVGALMTLQHSSWVYIY
jgi:tetratricopeptide (TPR) repeat protein